MTQRSISIGFGRLMVTTLGRRLGWLSTIDSQSEFRRDEDAAGDGGCRVGILFARYVRLSAWPVSSDGAYPPTASRVGTDNRLNEIVPRVSLFIIASFLMLFALVELNGVTVCCPPCSHSERWRASRSRRWYGDKASDNRASRPAVVSFISVKLHRQRAVPTTERAWCRRPSGPDEEHRPK